MLLWISTGRATLAELKDIPPDESHRKVDKVSARFGKDTGSRQDS